MTTETGAKAIAVMSLPRFGVTENMAGAFRAFGAHDIPVCQAQGPWWHHSLTGLMEQGMAQGADLIFTVDFDTIFGPEAVSEMLRLFDEYPEVDALCGIQIRRGSSQIMGQPTETPGNGAITRMAQAHFGLTGFRRRALQALARPWFREQASPSGNWGDDSVHADIGFWRNWTERGLKLFQANTVPIGHLDSYIAWPKHGGGVVLQHIGQWHQKLAPPGATVGSVSEVLSTGTS